MDEKLNIVKLIEKDPNTRLSQKYKSSFINKLIENFTEHQQQLFVSIFYCYLFHNSKKDFIVCLDNIWKWLGFSRKDNAKALLKKYFNENIDYKIVFLKSQENLKGGRPEEQITMTIYTFKKFCLKAGTKKADEIHDYYIKLEELLHETLNEETDELRNQLLLKDKTHNRELKKKKHETLVNLMRKKKCVYLGEIEEDKIKIGSSKSINERNKSLGYEYNNDILFLDIFESDNFREVEENILNDPIIKENLCKEKLKANGKSSKEVIQLSKDFSYEELIKIVKKHVNETVNSMLSSAQLLEKQKMEIERHKMDIEKQKMDREFVLELIRLDKDSDVIKKSIGDVFPEMVKNILQTIDKDKIKKHVEEQMEGETEEIIKDEVKKEVKKLLKINKKENNNSENKIQNPDNKILVGVNRNARKPQGRKIRKIDPNDLTKVVKVYECMSYLMRSPENERFKKACLEKALNHNSIYQGYRWNYVEEGQEPNIANAEPTKESKHQNSDVILELNSSKTKIINSYSTKKELKKKLGISLDKLNKIMNGEIQFNDSYYVNYADCPESLLLKFNGSTTRIVNAANSLGPIKRIDPITKNEIIFNTFEEIDIKLGFRRPTIKKAIENKILWGGFLWEYGKKENK